MLLTTDAGVIPCSRLYSSWRVRRRVISSSAARIDSVVVSAYMITRPLMFRAARTGSLDEGPRRAQETLLVRVEDRDQRHLGQIEPLAEQVDADQDIERAAAQIAQNLHPLERVDVGVKIADANAELLVELREVLRHPLRQRRDQDPLAARRPLPNLVQEIVDLPLHRTHVDGGVDETGRPDDLLDDDAPRCAPARRSRAWRRRR